MEKKPKKIKACAIWAPRYHDNKVLISCSKVSETKDTYVFICGDKNYSNLYKIPAKNFFHYNVGTNGKIYCFEVPIKDLEDVGELPDYLKLEKEKELNKFRQFNTFI